MYQIDLDFIRYTLNNSLENFEHKKNFKHPFSGIYYNIFIENGLIHIIPKAKTKGEEKNITRDGLLYFWLENDNYKE